jgi:hypothetical protein
MPSVPSKFSFSKPSASSGGFSKDEHEDHALVFVDARAEEMSTAFGDTTAARCSYVICLDDELVESDVVIFGIALVPAIVDPGEEIVVGHLVKGDAKPGRNPPWLLEDPTDEVLARAEAFFAKRAARLPSGRIVIGEEAF